MVFSICLYTLPILVRNTSDLTVQPHIYRTFVLDIEQMCDYNKVGIIGIFGKETGGTG